VSASDPLALVGRTIGGHFRVEEVIAEGRHSLVYRAKHVGPDELVAIRVLKLGVSSEPARVESFVRKWRTESSAISGVVLGDPQLVRTIEYGTAATGAGTFAPFSATEWLDGRSLADEVAARGAGLSLREAMTRIDAAVSALAYAHRSGVAHGSLSPRCLFIAASEDGPQVRVLDLGLWIALAEVLRAQSAAAEAASLFVSPWSAPEHLDPSLGDVGLATDVYALALVVAEALRGRPILTRDADEATIRGAVLGGAHPASRSCKDLGLSLGGHVERVMARALLHDPTERWPDIGVFWGALRGAAADDEAGVPLASWTVDEHDTARRLVAPDPISDQMTPTGLTPTGMTPTGPNPASGDLTESGVTPTGPGPRPDAGAARDSGSHLVDFDESETTEMAPFAVTMEMGIPPAAGSAPSLVRRPDDEDLTPVRSTSSSKTRAAKARVHATPAGGAAMPTVDDASDTAPAPPVAPRAPSVGSNGKSPTSERRRAAKPGDPPAELAGSGRATGLKVTVPAPAANIRVDDLPSVIVEGSSADDDTGPHAEPAFLQAPPVSRGGGGVDRDDMTVVQLEPPVPEYRAALAASRAPSLPSTQVAAGRPRSMPAPAPMRHYGASERRARERRRQLVLVGFAVFVAVAIAMAIALGLRGVFSQ
jgi:serine/threonine-protein kinase